ncbi:MAG: rhodanese-like domain-containing protein [Thermoanaerobaculia bacterium]
MLFRQIADDKLSQYAYLIGCQKTGEALLVDPQRDVDRYLEAAVREGLRIAAVTETHIHADFLSGVREVAHRLPEATVYLSAEGGEEWSYRWAAELGGRARLLGDGDRFEVGRIGIEAVHSPGHTPEHLAFLVVDGGRGGSEPMGMASGDFVFVGDLGRPDLLESAAGQVGAMEPSARRLWASAQRFLELPDHLQVWPGHGAGSACGKALGAVPQTTVGYEKRTSPALAAALESEDGFVEFILTGQPEPPPYFARMKELNRQGPPVLGDLPAPRRLSPEELGSLSGRLDVTVVDTRGDRDAFLAGHLPGSIYAPQERTFPTIVGSYVDPELPIVLVVDEAGLEEAVRDLVRIGYDRIEAWAPPEALQAVGERASIPKLSFADLEDRREDDGVRVLDVRGRGEWEAGHVPGALRIAHTRLAPQRDELPAGTELLVHCASGQRAGSAVSWLAREGYRPSYVGGLFGRWAAMHPEAVVRGT